MKKNNTENIVKLINDNEIDIAVFAEFSSTDFPSAVNSLDNKYTISESYGGCEKILLIAKNNVKVTIRREQSRYILYTILHNNIEYILAGIHLPANPHNNADARKCVIRDLVSDIKDLENSRKHKKTIIIGDFNASPFDSELIQKDCFNAVLFKELINKNERIKFENKYYYRFYNPTLNYLSEENKQYGSYYNSNGISSLYWYFFDQVIVRKDLANSIDNIEYLKFIGNIKLIKAIMPDKDISDHLPLLVTFERIEKHV